MVAMETGHFLKTLNDDNLASLGFIMWKVLLDLLVAIELFVCGVICYLKGSNVSTVLG